MRVARGGLCAAAALLMVATSGCWLQIGGGSDNTHFNPDETVLTAETVGTLHRVGGSDSRFEHFSEPVVSANRMFTTKVDDAAGGKTTVEAQTVDGKPQWSHPLLDGSAAGAEATPVVVLNDAVWVAPRTPTTPACTSVLERLDLATGAVLSSESTGRIASYMVGDTSIVTHLAYDGCTATKTLVVRDATSRAVLWTYAFPSGDDPQAPTLSGDQLYVSAGAHLYMFNRDFGGTPQFTVDAGAGQFRGRAIAGPRARAIVAYAPSPSAPAATTVRGYTAGDGTLNWETTALGAGEVVNGVAVVDEYMYVSQTGRLAIYSLLDCHDNPCAPFWTSTPIAGLAAAPPTIGGGLVYLAADADIVVIDVHGCGGPTTCAPLHRFTQPGPYTGLGEGFSLASGFLYSRMPGGSFLTTFAP